MKHNSAPSVVAIIPARYASTRFPGKALSMIAGKSLIQRTYENAKLCSTIDKWIVATDDQRIFDHVLEFGGDVIMTPVDCPTGSDRIAFVVKNNPELLDASVIINIQGDEPCLHPESIDAVIRVLLDHPSAVMSTAVYPLTSIEEACSPHHVKCVLDIHKNILYFSRSLIPGFLPTPTSATHTEDRRFPQIPNLSHGVAYYKHVGMYAFRPDFLLKYAEMPMTSLQQIENLEQLKVLENGYKIKAAIIRNINFDVNIPEDIQKVELELCKQNLSS